MAPSKKKKKAVGNPARGFATVSLPSRASVARQEDDIPEGHGPRTQGSPDEAVNQSTSSGDIEAGKDASSAPATNIPDMSPQQLEEHLRSNELQSLIDEYGSKCKSEALRQVARLETERRMLRLQAAKASTTSWCPEQLVNDILQASCLIPDPESSSTSQSIGDTENGLLLKLWALQQVFSQLRLPAVDQALLHILQMSYTKQIASTKDDIWGLSEALDWYALHANEYDLANYDYTVPKPRTEPNPSVSGVNTGEISKGILVKSSASENSYSTVTETPTTIENLDVPESTEPSTACSEMGSVQQRQQTQLEPGSVSQALAGSAIYDADSSRKTTEDSEPELQTDSEDDGDPAELVHKYVQIKSRLLISIEGGASTISQSRREKLEYRMESMERDILFDKTAAEAAWRELQPKLLANLASERLANRSKTSVSEPESEHPRDLGLETNGSSDEALGLADMFGEGNSVAESSQTNQGDPVNIVDFGNWTGIHPRKLLEEFCKVQDEHCHISVRLISSSSFAFRHSVSVKWSTEQDFDAHSEDALPASTSHGIGPRTLDLQMCSIAAPSKTQSEAYICTLALFIVAAQSPRGSKLRLRLPPVWRDLWTDLLQNRTQAIGEFDKSALKHIQTLIGEARNAYSDGPTCSTLRNSEHRDEQNQTASAESRFTGKFTAEDARSEWNKRASSASFQAMVRVRTDLPIHAQKDWILETVASQPIAIICAETGAGKSTQVPSYILENELTAGRDCRILVTQPRRISAISIAKRVSQELGERGSSFGTRNSLVGYAIRLESKTSSSTRITFATTGVLLRMLESSPNLDEVDYVILDEVHERTMDLDLLFIALRRAIVRRPTLKLVLMSATIDADRLSRYFGEAPVLDIAGRTYPVEVGFLEDAVEACVDHIPKHKWKPQAQGDTEDDEIPSDVVNGQPRQAGDLQAYSSKTRAFLADFDEYRINYDLITKLLYVVSTGERYKQYSSAILVFMPGLAEIRRLQNAVLSEKAFQSGWTIHLLHSSFSSDDLERAFAPPPRGCRKIVIATNIAETGVTIPDVTAVIDTCKEKVMRFDERRQVSKLVEGYVSRSSGRQRRGRAARVQPGLCFHLVTKYRFENLMPERHVPEILRLSLQDPILRIKIWDLGEIEETLLAAIDPPTTKNIRRAVEALKEVGALTNAENLTSLGRQLARLPLDVELGKLCLLGIVFRCLDPAVTITAILSSKSPFQSSRTSHNQSAPSSTSKDNASDLLSTYIIYQGWRKAKMSGLAAEFCRKQSLNEQNLSQIEDQRVSLFVSLVDSRLVDLDESEKSALKLSRLRHSARDFFCVPERYQTAAESGDAICAVIAMAFYPKLLGREGKHWRNVSTNQHVHLNWSPANTADRGHARWMAFYQALQTKSGQLNVTGTAPVPESAICLLLGQAEFRLYSGVIKVDGSRVQMAVRDWRSLLAIKVLRREIALMISRFLRSPGGTLTEKDETWFRAWLGVVSARK